MKKLALIVLALVSFNASAAIMGAPFIPEVDKRFNNIEQNVYSVPEAANSGVFVDHHAKAIVSLGNAGTYATSINLPANAIIIQAYWLMDTKGTVPSGTTLAFQCDSANDVYSAADVSAVSAGTITAGVETGTAATMHMSSSGCNLKAVVAVHNMVGTVADLFVHYVVAK